MDESKIEEELNKLGRHHWILDADHQPKPVPLGEWAFWFENHRVQFLDFTDQYSVSTIYTGIASVIDSMQGRAHLPPTNCFETCSFGTGLDPLFIQLRCSTYEEARAQHEAVLQRVRQMLTS